MTKYERTWADMEREALRGRRLGAALMVASTAFMFCLIGWGVYLTVLG